MLSNEGDRGNFNKKKEVIKQYMDAVGRVLGENWKFVFLILFAIAIMILPIMPATNLVIHLESVENNRLTIIPTENNLSIFAYFLIRDYNALSNYNEEQDLVLNISFFNQDGSLKYETQRPMQKSSFTPNMYFTSLFAESFVKGERIVVTSDTGLIGEING